MHILWLKTELLHPVDKGGKIRTYQTLKHLKALHQVTYLCLDDGSAAPDAETLAREYSHDLIRVPFSAPAKGTVAFYADLARNVVSSLPYAVAKYRSRAMEEAIRTAVRERDIDLVVCDFLFPSINVPDDLGVPVLLFQHNVEAAIWRRHAEAAGHPVKQRYMRAQYERMRAWERRECRRVAHVVAVSEQDAADMAREYGVSAVSAVPTGVDLEFFTPSGAQRQEEARLVFVGSMDWMPNEDGTAWFVREILPAIRAEVPGVHLDIVGRNPSPAVQALAREDASVTVTGTVSDVRPYVERAAVSIVPLRVGGGTRLKIFEGMALESAIVSTTIGAEGLPLVDGEEIVIADGPAAFAQACVRLMRDAAARATLGRAASARVRRDFGWDRAAAAFAQACEQLVGADAGAVSPRPSAVVDRA
jgi:sugar transferase (PEP-CTERM/EpsH1 system associated)